MREVNAKDSSSRYPLLWPEGWPRSKYRHRAAFGKHSIAVARDTLLDQLRRLGATQVLLSTNIPVRASDGLFYGNAAQPGDPAVAVYFKLKGENRVLACDRWLRVEHNLWALAKHIDAIRGQERWGVGSTERAFSAYKALPPKREWWEVLGLPGPRVSPEEVRSARRERAKEAHVDVGGDHNSMVEINLAYEAGLEATGGLD